MEVKGLLQNQQLPCREQKRCANFFHSLVQILLYCTTSRSAGSFTDPIIHSFIHLSNADKHIFHTQHGVGTGGGGMKSQAKSCCHQACGPERQQ